MNICLLAKWIFKIESGDDNIWCNLLRRKYLGEKGIFSCKKNNSSQFWKGLMAIRNECARGLKYIVGNGKRTRFWLDTWARECPLKITFPSIFTICNQQEWSVHRVLNSDHLNLTFRRNFGDIENQEYFELREMMSEVQLTNSQDSVRWILERS
jgi:hypothetical protein